LYLDRPVRRVSRDMESVNSFCELESVGDEGFHVNQPCGNESDRPRILRMHQLDRRKGKVRADLVEVAVLEMHVDLVGVDVAEWELAQSA
jgi:hypothetical protein